MNEDTFEGKMGKDMDEAAFEELAGTVPMHERIGQRAKAIIKKRASSPMLIKKSGIAESARQKKKHGKKKRAYDKLVNQLNPPYKVY